MQDDNIGLSRRKVLVGLGAVGVASAGAGLGTTAYFSDEESFLGNTLTAGELTLYVNYHAYADQGEYLGEYLMEGIAGEGESEVEHSFELDDVKPGDSGRKKFCFSVVDNPAYLWGCGMLTGEVAGTGGGQLADYLTATLRYCPVEDSEPNGAPGEVVDGDVIVDGSFRDVLSALRNGVPLDANGDGEVPIEDRACFDGSESLEDFQETCLCLDWEFPIRSRDPDAELDNNDAQAASMEFDLTFYAEQCRHNDGLTNPCVTTREGEGWGKAEGELENPSWHARGIFGDGGGAANRELDIRDPGDDPIHTGDENYAWPNGEAVPFSLTIDGGDAKWTVGGNEVMVEDAPLPVADGVGVTVKTRDADASITVEDVTLNGSSPTGADSVSASGSSATNYLMLEGATLQEGDVVSGLVTMSWNATPGREDIGFRIDV
ncbi:M73 family secreted endopeptidase [Halalkaliarchaeum sp. AArc-CO]|uniref:CalY family protein n=1 Tax=unclassified Halalkaliarchaeum TaxID=2678344 RepID=UPI00217E7A56|nr:MULTISPECIES: CalY family protein [unclassified Halalkaliarchaeum]MDR5671570.1 CalY family protein [Halalkaliarchaeum sp. AArc-GB]UWG51070.1 M73 family secreted endopeptidase [Halalkaliarchaeum sp. AArc-CO]